MLAIIYQWNGASPKRFADLRRDYDLPTVQLPESYRGRGRGRSGRRRFPAGVAVLGGDGGGVTPGLLRQLWITC